MEDIVNDSVEIIFKLHEKISKLKEYLSGKEISAQLEDAFKSFDNVIKQYNQAIENNLDMEARLNSVFAVSVYGQIIAQNLHTMTFLGKSTKDLGAEILSESQVLRDKVVNRKVVYNPEENVNITIPQNYSNDKPNEVENNLKSIIDDHNLHDQRIKKALSENESRISLLDSSLKKVEDSVAAELKKVKQLYEDTLAKLTEKDTQMDNLLGLNAGKAIASDFEISAKDERDMANYLRWGSLFIMLLIIVIVGYTFYETTADDFKWENSIFRISLTFLLSIPAAYLARESAKHRTQQYSHLQTSLDLKAITPYIASLPEEEQHKLKIEMANRIFASKDFSEVSKDPYPLDTQKIIMELIKNVKFKKSNNLDVKGID